MGDWGPLELVPLRIQMNFADAFHLIVGKKKERERERERGDWVGCKGGEGSLG